MAFLAGMRIGREDCKDFAGILGRELLPVLVHGGLRGYLRILRGGFGWRRRGSHVGWRTIVVFILAAVVHIKSLPG